MTWEVVIGLETHAQLSTRSKIFSGASTAFGAPANSQASAVDIALPGVLPVLNKGAVERAIRFGLAVDAKINPRSIFARKNYFYPDLPKGYQISQYELPVVEGGTLEFVVGEQPKTVRLTRAHLEEDAGKSLHEDFHGMSGIDLNRAGTPLLEIVSEPEMRSSAEAVAYAKTLHALVRWIDICDGNMQEGSFRCDANVSVRRPGGPLGTRCEIKNLNSFRFLERAIEFEVSRQIGIIEDGGTIVQETRLYDPDKDETRSMRSKEDAHDYRYFPDPDLLPLEVSQQWIDEIRASMGELQQAKRERYVKEFGISPRDAELLTQSREMAEYFEEAVTVAGKANAKLCANWIVGDLASYLNRDDRPIAASLVSAPELGFIVLGLAQGRLHTKTAREALQAMWEAAAQGKREVSGFGDLKGAEARMSAAAANVERTIAERGLGQISNLGELEQIVDSVLAASARQVADYRAGREKAFNSLVGQVMKATKGKASPAQVNAVLKQKLDNG